ncbi:MAG: hypothetical protein HFI74_11385 [Lachnospiraceae bacterium]|nr:hypothetical protein [Lachnospiraceae bacterium]
MRIGKENLVAQLQLHNEKALEYLVMEHGERLISIIRKHLFTLPHLQQNCLGSTIQAVWDHVDSFHKDNEFENWIGSVARYCCLEYLEAHQEEATIAWLIQKEIAEEKEMMATCLGKEEQELFYQLVEAAQGKGFAYIQGKFCDVYALLNRIDTDIFEYEKEPLTLQEKEEVLKKIQNRKKEKKRKFSLKRYLKATELQLS